MEAKAINWILEPYIPLGSITSLDGPPGCGKSQIAIHFARRVQDESPGTTVVLCSPEDLLSEVVAPRMAAAGLTSNDAYIIAEAFELSLDALVGIRRETQASLIIIDPLQAFMPKYLEMGSVQDMRSLLQPIAQWCEEEGISLLLLRHLTKAASRLRDKSMFGATGSVDIAAIVRSVMVCTPSDDPPIYAMTHAKSSLGPPAEPMTYIIRSAEAFGCQTSVIEIVDAPSIPTHDASGVMALKAMAFIDNALANIREMPAAQLDGMLAAADISRSTFDRALRQVGGWERRKIGKSWVIRRLLPSDPEPFQPEPEPSAPEPDDLPEPVPLDPDDIPPF